MRPIGTVHGRSGAALTFFGAKSFRGQEILGHFGAGKDEKLLSTFFASFGAYVPLLCTRTSRLSTTFDQHICTVT